MALSQTEQKLLLLLSEESPIGIAAAAHQLSLSRDAVGSAAEGLAIAKLAKKEPKVSSEIFYTQEGISAQEKGLPEVKLLKLVANSKVAINSLPFELRNFGISMAKKSGWIEIEGGFVQLSSAGLASLNEKKYFVLPADPSQLKEESEDVLSLFESRNIITRKLKIADLIIEITESGKVAAAALPKSMDEIGSLDRQSLLGGSWKTKKLAKYDLSAEVSESLAARRHPISRLRSKVGQIFIEMGFEEMQGPLAESAFWNFDALFQPQDHPARDLADTFYIGEKSPLPEHQLVSRVSSAHKKGWLYDWSEEEASQTVLRTHTTAVSARALFENKQDPSPKKYFSIGKVFRNEATDYKHLAEFFQVEGIIAWNGATFAHLLGTLKEFYCRLGFGKVRFRPSYFPYTEPSLEVEVFHPAKNAWLELGGAGVFRPEVSLPICKKYPVLAWGLSLERPLMLSSKTEDIRTLYRNDLGWLRNFKLTD